MADEPQVTHYEPVEPNDLPPASSPGGGATLRGRARGRAGAGTNRASARREPASAPPAEDEMEDPKRPWTPKERVLRESILELYTGAQVACQLFDPPTAVLIGNAKEQCADAWMDLTRRDPRVKAFLIKITTGSAWGGLVMAHVPILLPVLARKGILPGGALFGGAAFNAMPDQPSQDWPPSGEEIFTGSVPFNGNGNGSHTV